MKHRGFTLIELLVVIVILGILITLASRGIRSAKVSAKKAKAMVEMSAIETAIKAYQNKYGQLPVALDAELAISWNKRELDPESERVVSVLTGAQNRPVGLNRADMVFLDPQGAGRDGVFLDPWGYQYRIALDANYDGLVDVFDEPLRRSAAVVSVGLYYLRDCGDTNDVIRGWN